LGLFHLGQTKLHPQLFSYKNGSRLVDHSKPELKCLVWIGYGSHLILTIQKQDQTFALYSIHPKAGPSEIRMVISRTFFVSGIQMASLDRFIVKKIFSL
jgi:hypothetical protein